jgi:hypothetical protein
MYLRTPSEKTGSADFANIYRPEELKDRPNERKMDSSIISKGEEIIS